MEQAQCKPYKFLHVLVVNRLLEVFFKEKKGVISQMLVVLGLGFFRTANRDNF